MTEEEYRQQVNERWKETMALLGFDDPGPAPETESVRAEPSQPIPSRHKEPEIHVEVAPRQFVSETVKFEQEIIAVPRSEEPSSAQDTPPVQMDRPEARTDLDGGDDKSDRRRRGRRGRRGSKSESKATGGETDAAVVAPASRSRPVEDKEDGRKRGRGRTRERPARTEEHERADEDESVIEEAGYTGDIGDDDSTDLTDWDIPSWQELIASLYRPER